MARPEIFEDWMREAIEAMVQNGQSLKQAAMDLGKEVSSAECETILRRRSFNRALHEARYRYFNQLVKSPNFTKDTGIGKLWVLAQKLEEEGKSDKAADAIFKLAKLAGWVGPESQVSIFGELSAKDLNALRDTVLKQKETVN